MLLKIDVTGKYTGEAKSTLPLTIVEELWKKQILLWSIDMNIITLGSLLSERKRKT